MCDKCGSLKWLKEVVDKYEVPFKCKECGSIDFPFKATRDVAFLWESVAPTKVGSLFLPDMAQDKFKKAQCVVLSIGPGWMDKGNMRFHPTEVKVGQVVLVDPGTPWIMDVEATDGKKYPVRYMGERDLKCIVTED